VQARRLNAPRPGIGILDSVRGLSITPRARPCGSPAHARRTPHGSPPGPSGRGRTGARVGNGTCGGPAPAPPWAHGQVRVHLLPWGGAHDGGGPCDDADHGVRVQCCGDAHLCNFGGFATPERRIIFSINDLDETLPAPWEWDIKRLTASFVVACRDNGLSEAVARDAAMTCARSYRESMAEFSQLKTLELWYRLADR